MMDFIINHNELAALYGLPHCQQFAYFRGIRPHMDVKTGMVGIKRGISYQSIAEQVYVEPHQGIKSETYSRMQIRRALASLVRVGLISVQSQGLKLILKCELASRPYSVQNKLDLKPTHLIKIIIIYYFYLKNSGKNIHSKNLNLLLGQPFKCLIPMTRYSAKL